MSEKKIGEVSSQQNHRPPCGKQTCYHTIVDHANVGYFFMDANGFFQHVNRAWLDMHGYASQDEVVGKHFSVTQIEEEEAEAHQRLESLLVGSWLPVGKRPRRRKDGSVAYHTVLATPVFRNGHTVGVEGLLFDVTEQQHREEALRHRELDAERQRRIRSLSDFASNVAHDFNNILMAILGHAEFALTDLSRSSPVRTHIAAIQDEARRAAEMCNHLLSFTDRDDAGVEMLNLSEMVRSMHHMLQVLAPRNTELLYQLHEEPPPVEGETRQIHQVVANLVARSCEFETDAPGTVYLGTDVIDAEEFRHNHLAGLPERHLPEAFVVLTIGPDPQPLAPARRQRVFNYSAESLSHIERLGLAAVQNIVHGHRGLLKVLEDPGLTFAVLFPACRRTGPSRPRSDSSPWRTSGKVLLVDDDPRVRQVAGAMLERVGFTVLIATSGPEALELFDTGPGEFALVLLDVSMPGMNGIEVLEQILGRRDDIPVILSSGYSEERVTRGIPGQAPTHFIQKPYDMESLRRKVQEILAPKA